MLSVHSLMQEAKVPSGARSKKKGERRLTAGASNDLPEQCRLILGLRYYESVRPAQIAAALGLPEEEVRQTLADALTRLLEAERKAGAAAPVKAEARRRTGKGSGE